MELHTCNISVPAFPTAWLLVSAVVVQAVCVGGYAAHQRCSCALELTDVET